MNRQAQAVVLLLVGGAVLRSSLTDLYLRYVKQGLRPFLIAAGALLVVAAVMTLWYEFRGGRAAHDHEGHPQGDDGHSHAHGPWVAWLLILPVFALLLVSPPALGSYAASRNGTALQQVSDFPPLPAGDPVKISVLDYASRAVFDGGRSIGDRTVRLTGFVVTGGEGGPYLARMVLSCCAADARPVKVALTGEVPAGLKADSWIEVTGRYTAKTVKDAVNGETIPYLEVIDLAPVAAPNEQYES
ncbi:TIGR03943 family putative permease subunit [Planosporangium sp. 12N6]|uniref:TIGR03943 family putative permease subunit n=1 Tax=Planosporangium spinosum TaxID=3402278 RepID=UPI003CF96B11